jgi:hypothetical protein
MIPSPTNPRRQYALRRWVRGMILLCFLSPLALWLGSNLWLQSAWGKSWLAAQIQLRTNLPVRIGGAGWLPGGQIWLDDLRVVIPTADNGAGEITMFQVRCISIRPAWGAWMRGSRKISDVCLSQPRLEIPLDALQQLMPAPVPPAPAPATAVAAANPNTTQPTPADPGTAPAAPPAAAEPVAPEPPSPTVWLKITDGSLAITHPAVQGALWEMQNISSDLPIGGAPASGHVQCAAIKLAQSTLCDLGRIDIRWQYPLWESEETPLSAMQFRARSKFQLARVAGLPFSAQMAQDPQAWKSPTGDSAIGQMQSRHQLSGFLLAPQTWRGESLMEAQQCQLTLGTRHVQSFLAQARFLLQGGLLQCPEFRWLGDDLGITGNGIFTMRGEMLGRILLIAPRPTAQAWSAKWQQRIPDHSLPLQALYNEDRFALDTLWGGSLRQPWLSLDQGKNLLDPARLWQIWNQAPSPTRP